ncbi:PAS domain-containing sensor histidine kinase [Halorubellus sp. JP-L1]|uniref:sensor histidine kinase n=1 Tax=Halorubellus sp. JP-L1 TaxID=2715753 RepID=UPI00140C5B7C|nr:histidine kinase N-terminal 7TM domain-containing protein [Halorubellus sp. JP-L1]NHN41030.1 PAS domain-containing sensor histidine kinase [Halorubellus sp. JP-L1]
MIDGLLPFVYTASAVLTGGLAVLTWRNQHSDGSRALTGILAGITFWLVAIVAAETTTALAPRLQWAAITFLGTGLTVAFLFLFALRYAGYVDVLAGRRALVLAVHPVAIALLALTSQGSGVELFGVGGHELLYEYVDMAAYDDGSIEWAWGFWVHVAYAYVLVAASSVLILKTTLTSNDTYRWQSVTVGIAILVPWLADVVEFLLFENVNGLLALGFGVSGILLALSVHRFELSNVTPVARPVVMEAVADGVLVVGAHGRIVDLNSRARDLLDLDEDALGADAFTVLPGAFDAFEDPETAPTRERVTYDSRTLEVETTPFGDDDETGRVFVVRDVTEQHAYRTELERKTERLDRFASVVSHDLRNPLSVAKGYADIAEETGDPDAFAEVHAAHDRMESLIEDVLLMAREGETSTDPEPVALADLAERAWATVDTANATLDASAADGAILHADPDRTVQLFENLFRNSVEHGGPDVAVSVGVLDDAGFYVADDGTGIDPDVRDDLFETGVTGGDGTGLGLAIVDRIADAHGWTVTATDGTDGGARFEFRGVDTDPNTPDAGPGAPDADRTADDAVST